MNSAEKNVLFIAVALFIVGLAYRFIPWGLPAIEQVEVVTAAETPARTEITDKVIASEEVVAGIDDSGSVQKKKRSKRQKKKGKVVRLPVHINAAGIDELCALKGVGPKLAEKIIAFREQNGPFLGPGDLEKVPGIGKKKAEGILQGVIFD
ncbi:ComEA family DNA-binding protein [Fibrobacter sp. UBA4309]|uniref:ComEA family DNA-binding protein n=1 Tax=Fibrobacter sp. UBA4309 TaxID=1946537 RepID=UPI0025B9CA50|nr:helix-hairpin-helix domain-containing protein [Fibrobacter sp. UBA4309]